MKPSPPPFATESRRADGLLWLLWPLLLLAACATSREAHSTTGEHEQPVSSVTALTVR